MTRVPYHARMQVAAYAGGAHRVYALGAADYWYRDPARRWFVSGFMNVLPISRRALTQRDADALRAVVAEGTPERPVAVRGGTLTVFWMLYGFVDHSLP